MIRSMHDLRELSYAECRAALDLATVGRVALCAPDGPHIFPVNFVVLDESIILRTTAFSFLGTHGRDATIAFEVDQVDEDRKEGWSVQARGRAVPVDDPLEREWIRQCAQPVPWVRGPRNLYLRMAWMTLTGRCIGSDPLVSSAHTGH
jgi:nitroimidazol reductase NimA-like FMN-containing flavoprotein (pyridoxamine 5'-phosphate oxidase superfamily)